MGVLTVLWVIYDLRLPVSLFENPRNSIQFFSIFEMLIKNTLF